MSGSIQIGVRVASVLEDRVNRARDSAVTTWPGVHNPHTVSTFALQYIPSLAVQCGGSRASLPKHNWEGMCRYCLLQIKNLLVNIDTTGGLVESVVVSVRIRK